jgi:hypothetical protein
LQDLTIGPVLTWTTDAMLAHMQRLLQIPGAKLLFGGKALRGHTIPPCYGAIEPTAVFVSGAAAALQPAPRAWHALVAMVPHAHAWQNHPSSDAPRAMPPALPFE